MPKIGKFDLIKKLVLSGACKYSEKVEDCLDVGDYSEEDLEHCILKGRVYKIEKDEMKSSIDNKKYTIKGKDTYENYFYTEGKIVMGASGNLYFFMTAHS
jgi:hypothetical protein